MNYKFITIVLIFTIFYSCNKSSENFNGFWVEKKYENETVIITDNGNSLIVENSGKKYPAEIEDGILEISAELPLKGVIDENKSLIIAGKEYIRIEKAKSYKFVKFEDCSLSDFVHITFDGISQDFGYNHRYNEYNGYQLCTEDKNGNTIPNPKYVGKEFIIKWDNKKVKIEDPTDPWKTSYQEKPRITFLKLNE